MMPPTSIDGTDITGATIDGTDVQEITVDGQTVFTATLPTIIDDFNDQSLSEYQGATGDYSFTTNSFEGSHALESNAANQIFSTSGLDNYPSPGDTFRFYFNIPSSGTEIVRIQFAVGNNGDDHYFVELDNRSFRELFQFYRVDDDFNNNLVSTNTSVTSNTWNYFEIDWSVGGSFTIELYDASDNFNTSLSATDSTYSNGGIGIRSEAGVLHDDFRLV